MATESKKGKRHKQRGLQSHSAPRRLLRRQIRHEDDFEVTNTCMQDEHVCLVSLLTKRSQVDTVPFQLSPPPYPLHFAANAESENGIFCSGSDTRETPESLAPRLFRDNGATHMNARDLETQVCVEKMSLYGQPSNC